MRRVLESLSGMCTSAFSRQTNTVIKSCLFSFHKMYVAIVVVWLFPLHLRKKRTTSVYRSFHGQSKLALKVGVEIILKVLCDNSGQYLELLLLKKKWPPPVSFGGVDSAGTEDEGGRDTGAHLWIWLS